MSIIRKLIILILTAIIGLISAAVVVGTFAITAPIAVVSVLSFLLYTLGSFIFAVVRGVCTSR